MKFFMLYILPWLISILGIIGIGIIFSIVYFVVQAFGGDASAIKTLGIWICSIVYFAMVLITHFALRINTRLWN